MMSNMDGCMNAGRLHVCFEGLGSVFFTGKRCWDLSFLIRFARRTGMGQPIWLTTDSLGWEYFEHHRRSGLSSGEEAKR